jgi:hypothetical protein
MKQMISTILEVTYTKDKIGEDGKIEIVTLETMRKDTLSNGK